MTGHIIVLVKFKSGMTDFFFLRVSYKNSTIIVFITYYLLHIIYYGTL